MEHAASGAIARSSSYQKSHPPATHTHSYGSWRTDHRRGRLSWLSVPSSGCYTLNCIPDCSRQSASKLLESTSGCSKKGHAPKIPLTKFRCLQSDRAFTFTKQQGKQRVLFISLYIAWNTLETKFIQVWQLRCWCFPYIIIIHPYWH